MKLSYGIPLLDTLTPEKFEEYLILLKDIGYEGVEASVCNAAKIDRQMLKEKLDKHGMCFSGFRSGAVYDMTGARFSSPDKAVRDKAVEMMKAAEEGYYDAILMDIQMAQKSGIETLREIRGMEKCKDIPVIMITSKQDKATVVESSKLGVDDYVVKPFKGDDLRRRIGRVMGRAAE